MASLVSHIHALGAPVYQHVLGPTEFLSRSASLALGCADMADEATPVGFTWDDYLESLVSQTGSGVAANQDTIPDICGQAALVARKKFANANAAVQSWLSSWSSSVAAPARWMAPAVSDVMYGAQGRQQA